MPNLHRGETQRRARNRAHAQRIPNFTQRILAERQTTMVHQASKNHVVTIHKWKSRSEILHEFLNGLNPTELLRVRPYLYALKYGVASREAASGQKAYDPNQPRVPAGNPGAGEWTDEGRSARLARVRLAGRMPTNDPPEIPSRRPPDANDRTSAIKEVIRRLAKAGGPLGHIIGAAYWLYEYEAEIRASLDPPASLEDLQRAVMSPRAGYQRHHIVEQAIATQDGFPRTMIDAADNVVRIPTIRHREITAWYQTRNETYQGMSPRDYLRGKSWDERRKIGLYALVKHGVMAP